jgi:hypothetical protein
MHFDTNQYEIQRTNHFDVIMPADMFGDEFTLTVESFNIPAVSVGAISLSYGNADVKVAGKANTGTGSLVIKDAITQDMEKKIDNWRRKAYNPETDAVGWVEDYKRTMIVNQYGPDGTYQRQWKCIGCWVQSMSTSQFSYNSADKKLITLEISVDKAFPVRD